MDKIEHSQVERVLRNDDLDTVTGGFALSNASRTRSSSAVSTRSRTRLARLWRAKATPESEPGSI